MANLVRFVMAALVIVFAVRWATNCDTPTPVSTTNGRWRANDHQNATGSRLPDMLDMYQSSVYKYIHLFPVHIGPGLVFHAVNSALVMIAVSRFLGGNGEIASGLAAVAFAIHPVAVPEALCYAGNYDTMLSTTVTLLALCTSAFSAEYPVWLFGPILSVVIYQAHASWVAQALSVGAIACSWIAVQRIPYSRLHVATCCAMLAGLVWVVLMKSSPHSDAPSSSWLTFVLTHSHLWALRLRHLCVPLPSHASPDWSDLSDSTVLPVSSLADGRVVLMQLTLAACIFLALLGSWALEGPHGIRSKSGEEGGDSCGTPRKTIPSGPAQDAESNFTGTVLSPASPFVGMPVWTIRTPGRDRSGSHTGGSKGRAGSAGRKGRTPAPTSAVAISPSTLLPRTEGPAPSGKHVDFAGTKADTLHVTGLLSHASTFRLGLTLFIMSGAWSSGMLSIGQDHDLFAMHDTQLYLPLAVGGSLVLAAILACIQSRLTANTSISFVFVALLLLGGEWYACRTYASVWTSDVALWNHAAQVNPTSPLTWLRYGQALLSIDPASAVPYLERAEALHLREREEERDGETLLFPFSSAALASLAQARYGAALQAVRQSKGGIPVVSEADGGGIGNRDSRLQAIEAMASAAYADALQRYAAVFRSVAWRGEGGGRVVLTAADADARDASCSLIGTAAHPRPEQARTLSSHTDAAVTHVTAAFQVGELLLTASGDEGDQTRASALRSAALDAWLRGASLLGVSTSPRAGMPAPSSIYTGRAGPRSRADAALYAGDAFASLGLSSTASRLHEIAVHEAGDVEGLALVRAVTGALLQWPAMRPAVHVPPPTRAELAAAGSDEGAGMQDAGASQNGVAQALMTSAAMSLRSAAPRMHANHEDVLCLNVYAPSVRGRGRHTPEAVGYVDAEQQLAAMLGQSASHLLHTAPTCSTPNDWNSTCGRVLIAANRAAEAAVTAYRGSAYRSNANGDAARAKALCTCSRQQHAEQMEGRTTGRFQLCAASGLSLPEAPSESGEGVDPVLLAARAMLGARASGGVISTGGGLEDGARDASVPWSSLRHTGCGNVDGVEASSIPAALAGWLHCAANDTEGARLQDKACTNAMATTAALQLGTWTDPGPAGMPLPRALFLAARAHALTLLAVRHSLSRSLLTGTVEVIAGDISARSLRQALMASRSPLSALLDVCTCQ